MDNRTIYVHQAVDKTVVIKARDASGQRLIAGLRPGYRAEINFKRADGVRDVGRLSSALGHFRFVREETGVQEALHLTFAGEATEAWVLEPVLKTISQDDDTGGVIIGEETFYGTLLVRDENGDDAPHYSGKELPVTMRRSTTLGFTPEPEAATDE